MTNIRDNIIHDLHEQGLKDLRIEVCTGIKSFDDFTRQFRCYGDKPNLHSTLDQEMVAAYANQLRRRRWRHRDVDSRVAAITENSANAGATEASSL